MTHTPDILTTHQYVVDVIDAAFTTEARKVHQFYTDDIEPTASMPTAHILEARFDEPLKIEEGYKIGNTFGRRALNLTLWTGEGPSPSDHRPGRKTARAIDGNGVHRVLAESRMDFTTSRVIERDVLVSPDGEDIGLDADALVKVMYGLLATMSNINVRGHRSAAEAVALISFMTGHTEYQEQRFVGIFDDAMHVANQSGLSIPRSLYEAPDAFIQVQTSIPIEASDPAHASTKLTFNHNSEHGFTITEYTFAQYDNWPEEAPGKYDVIAHGKVQTLDGENTGTEFTIDVNQDVFVRGEKTTIHAHNDAEAREMMKPLIQGVTNLRRFATRAGLSQPE